VTPTSAATHSHQEANAVPASNGATTRPNARPASIAAPMTGDGARPVSGRLDGSTAAAHQYPTGSRSAISHSIEIPRVLASRAMSNGEIIVHPSDGDSGTASS
jgi:hypothetical protein